MSNAIRSFVEAAVEKTSMVASADKQTSMIERLVKAVKLRRPGRVNAQTVSSLKEMENKHNDIKQGHIMRVHATKQYKQYMCRVWKKRGICPNGAMCCFAHGFSDGNYTRKLRVNLSFTSNARDKYKVHIYDPLIDYVKANVS
jgi:hypothetical protein